LCSLRIFNGRAMLSPTVVVPVSPVGAIIDRPLVRLKVIVFGATRASLPTSIGGVALYEIVGMCTLKLTRLVKQNP
jgi:hypothetical protein